MSRSADRPVADAVREQTWLHVAAMRDHAGIAWRALCKPARPMQVGKSIAAIGVVAAVAGHAHAQSAEAASLFDDGDRLMARGQLAAACDAFEASNRIEARAGTLIRLGECREHNHQLASAWSAYKDALTRVKDPRKRDIAAGKTAALEPQLSYLIVSVPDDSRIDGLTLTRNGTPLDPLLWNRAMAVDGGTYTIGGRAPGHEDWSTTVVVPEARGKASVDVPRFKQLAKLVEPPRPAVTAAPIDTSPLPRRKRIGVAIGFATTSVVALAAGITLGIQASNRRHEADALCADAANCSAADEANALSTSARARAIGADIGFAVAGAAAIAAGVVWWIGESTSRAVAVAPSVSATQIGAMAVLRW